MKSRTVALLFSLGSFAGVLMAGLYTRFSPSPDRFFHAFVMLAACGVSFPAVVIFLRVTLKMWAMAEDQKGLMLELRNAIKPFVEEGKEVIAAVRGIIEDLKNQKAGKIIEFIERVERDGLIPKVVKSIEEIGRQVGEVIRRSSRHGGGEIEVPVISKEPPCDDLRSRCTQCDWIGPSVSPGNYLRTYIDGVCPGCGGVLHIL